ncbi:MFS transporter, partial [uncultured Weissella sp.]|uniref:MFS transporter n=1 Tax=uncultured Weissella sp. TaxID=253243 RepID=UPI0027DB9676
MKKDIQIALLMAASLFMEILDGTIVTTTLPRMSVDFSVNSTSAALLVSTYLITVAIFIPLSGWMAQRFGKKRIWLIAVAGFTLSSLACAIAPNFGFLLGMRVLQGISGALMTPTARLIVLEKTPSNLLLKMTSYLVWPALLAPAIAPLIGGVLITYLNWHWIFLINLPIGAMIFFIGIYLIPQDVIERVTRFDWIGFLQIA